MSRRALAVLFVPIAPLLLFSILAGSVWRLRTVTLTPLHQSGSAVLAAENAAAAAPSHTGIASAINSADARVDIVTNFLIRHNSPLDPPEHYARALVETADRYNLDYRLLPAIMMQESNLCKNAPAGTHNCLGFGIHARGTLGFESYEASFDRAAREIKERYIDIGLTTPEDIMTKYTPSSTGSWAFSVNQWIVEMEHDDRQLAREERRNNDLLEYTQE